VSQCCQHSQYKFHCYLPIKKTNVSARQGNHSFYEATSLGPLLYHSMEQIPSCEAERNSLDFMKPEDSLPHSQEPATCLNSELAQTTPNLLKIHFSIIFSPRHGSSNWSLSLSSPIQNSVYKSLFPHACYMSLPGHYFFISYTEQYLVISTDH
jgi:hypothetical protein